jgi:hypothetical protein
MKTNTKAAIVAALLIVVHAAVSYAAQDGSQNIVLAEKKVEAAAAEVTPQAAEAPAVLWPETTWEFGPVVEGKKIVHDFVIQNKGAGLLRVESVKTG